MLFSVLIANYNNSHYLETAIRSVFEQRYENWEIILVDDASTDGFEQLIGPLLSDKRIRVFRNDQNRGCGYTKMICAKKANGVLAAYLDPDDTLTPDALLTMVEAHTKMPSCSLISSTHYICDEQLNIKRVADYPKPLPEGIPYLLLSDGRIHAFASFKKARYDATDGIDPNNKKAVDQDLYYKLEETGEVDYIDRPLYHYRIHPGGISTFHKRHAATLWHYSIIEAACLRRIEKLRQQTGANNRRSIKLYRTRYHKIRIFHSFRKKEWFTFIKHLLVFPFVGGMNNIISYSKKLPREGFALLRRSFTYDHEIS